ncbi:nuclear transport factor 2 family protein [Tateyamaria omphalii]|uniref:nuclear transport factor 2 family protein n=1 Tax=Tateyamaria omphalii TaxID=299262 RepID=UPI001C99B670|nr:nuclear transport factor 2 family protein [Tateyamaria omphalii]MBY5935202.1 nuclear transport factor 2 family protein [Tateyamaria omphalii]
MNRTDDAAAVEAIVNTYIKGTADRDVDLLKTVFHENAVMAGYLGPAKLIGSPQPFYDHLTANEHGPGYVAKITHIAVTGRTAVARIVEDSLYGMSFVNDFHLMNDDGSWVITAKLFHHD